MSDTVKTETPAEAGKTRPATASNIVYKAYKRPYMEDDVPVLQLFASGEYPAAPYTMYFQGVPDTPFTYALMETVPGVVYYLCNYVTACFSSGYGIENLPNTITIQDAFGAHTVTIEQLT